MPSTSYFDATVMRPAPGRIGKLYGDLKVRPKLMVLHNLFFLILTIAVYFSVIPLFEGRLADARSREIALVTQMFSEDRPLLRLPGMEIYDYREGSAQALEIPPDAVAWLEQHPGATWQNTAHTPAMFRRARQAGLYRSLRIPSVFYDAALQRAKFTLFLVLGIIYILAVVLLETMIMPLYVYSPLRRFLNADAATHRGDRQRELIPDNLILGDEIGQIMRSRNTTIAELRKQEDDLATALMRLEEVAADLQRKNELLEAAKRKLMEQDRLASLGLLSASVAHELNTPLSVLQGSIEKMIETLDDPHSQQRLARMLRVTQRLRRISESLVDFARARRQTMEPVALRPLVDEAWGLVAIAEKASAVGFANLVRDDDVVIGNADRLVQVFVNLLRNALHAVQSGGNIVALSRRIEQDGRPWVALTVEDNGPGIAPDVLPEIFEAFVTTRLDARGTGLGLTVAEGIVTQHGGTIEASNRTGGGACLEVRLPVQSRSRPVTS